MIDNCRRCGRMYMRTERRICPDCIKEEERALEAVIAYLKEHRNATMAEVVEAVDVDQEQLDAMIREGKLGFAESADFTVKCDRCGAPSGGGQYCAKCKDQLVNELSTSTLKLQQQLREEQKRKGGYFSR